MLKYGYSGPDHQHFENFQIFCFYHIQSNNTLPTSPQPTSCDKYQLRYCKMSIKGENWPKMPKYGYSGADPQNFEKFLIFCFCHIQSNNMLPTSPQPTSYDKYQSRYCKMSIKLEIWPQMPKYGYLGPDPQIFVKFQIFCFYHIQSNNTLPTSPQPTS